MSFRDWCAAIAVGLILLGITPALSQQSKPPALKSDPVPNAGQQQRAQDGQQTAPAKEQSGSDLLPAIKSIETAIREHIAKEDKAESERKEKREVADLQAQEDMALWAKMMFFATLASVILTSFGLWLLYGTLHYTRLASEHTQEMVVEAKATTVEAKRTADVAERAQRGLERPYLFVEVVSTANLHSGRPRGLYYRITNYGKVPAIMRSVAVALPYNPGANLNPTLPITNEDFAVIAPGERLLDRTGDSARFVEVDDPPEGDDLQGATATLLTLHGILEYEDPTDTYYRDRFCMRATTGARSFRIDDRDARYNWRESRPKRRDERDRA